MRVCAGSLLMLALLVVAAVAAAARAATVNVPLALIGSCALLMALAAIGAAAGSVVACRRRSVTCAPRG